MHAPSVVDWSIPAGGGALRVIRIVPGQILTRQTQMPATIRGGLTLADPQRDLLKLAVVERHTGSGRVGKGFVSGLGLRRGALASSVAHDAHNVVVAGTSDGEMQAAYAAVVAMGGGLAVVCDGRVRARLPLPIAGLMTDAPAETVLAGQEALNRAARELGATPPDPFMTLSFLALPVIPELKLTDRGLVDVSRFDFVPLFCG
jgi:adenine deaminase